MPDVKLQSINKNFNNTPVIQDVCVEIADGEFCVLVGPSGSGKSTLLRLIAGLEQADSGQISIGSKDVTQMPPKGRDIAMVFQSYALYPQLSVRDNMGFGLRLAGESKAVIQSKVNAVADMLSLSALLDRFPKQLSGGQRQRVAMGRAMVREPAVFLFDEPLSNLDASLRASVRAEIRAMHAKSKTTSIYVTHDQVEAMTMGDKIVVLKGGRIEQVGTPVELYERPVNRFVASFIGSPSMNFCSLPVQQAQSGRVIDLADHRLSIPALLNDTASVELGIRPEDLRLGTGDSGLPSIPATVETVEYMGANTQICVATQIGKFVVTQTARLALAAGNATTLGFNIEKIHFFDATSGQRIGSPRI
jgi:multiple sugar transport system ATP-binding protein